MKRPNRQGRETPDRGSAASDLCGALSGVTGLSLQFDEPLGRYTTFRIGGPAELLVRADSERALRRLLELCRDFGIRPFLLGLGSNVLIPDQGLSGVIVRLGGYFGRYRIHGHRVSAGAAVPLGRLARRTAAAGLSGLEELSGFPSTVGGAVVMNAGSYGTEVRDLLIRATVLSRVGGRRRLAVDDLEAGYRSTALQRTGEIVTRAVLQLRPGDPKRSLDRIRELTARRKHSLPYGHGSAGSIFRNPPGDYAGRLIEECGLKGRKAGEVQISRKHANVIVNRGGGRADDVLELMFAARAAVAERFSVELQPELVLTGDLRQRWARGID